MLYRGLSLSPKYTLPTPMLHSSNLIGAVVLTLTSASLAPAPAWLQAPAQGAQEAKEIRCDLDLTRPGAMSDIISNALDLGFGMDLDTTLAYLNAESKRHATGGELLAASASHFGLSKEALTAEVEKYRHCNCDHPPIVEGQITARSLAATDEEPASIDAASPEVTQFARDVTVHVVLHEMAHALVREFDLPVLANEETLADAFATYYLTTHMPDRAFDVIQARTRSLMIEANEVPRNEWSVDGEHNSDARRAFQIAAVAIAADPEKYRPIAVEVGMSASKISGAADYGTEIHRSWRRLLRDLWLPEGHPVKEARFKADEDIPFIKNLCAEGLRDELTAALTRFDWHSQVTIHLTSSEGGAAWSRSRRTITVNREYVQRFVAQGKTLKD